MARGGASGGQNICPPSTNNEFQPISPINSSPPTPDPRSPDHIHNPFFLQSGDHPGLTLVSHVLTGINYSTWSRSMLMALNAKNKVGFVDGSLSQPSPDDAFSSIWSRCNSMVISWLLNAVSKEIVDSFLYLETSQAVWSDLYDRFHQSNAPRIFQIKQQLQGLSQGSLDLTTYYTRLKILWDELKNFQPIPVCHCGGMKSWMDYQQQEYVMQFLMGLNDSYSSICGQIVMLEPLPPVSKAFNLVVQEELQHSISSLPSSSPSDSMAFQSSSLTSGLLPTPRPPVAAVSISQSCPKRDRVTCSHCGISGHSVDCCYKIHGYPPGYKAKFKPKSPSYQSSLQSNSPIQQFSPSMTQAASSSLSPQAHQLSAPSAPYPPAGSLSTDQVQQLIAYLSSQLQHQGTLSPASSSSTHPSVSQICGSHSGLDDWEG